MKLRDCTGVAAAGLPRIEQGQFKLLWISDFWDAPLSGALLYRGQWKWFTLAEEEREPYAEGWFRRYWIITLTREQEAEERKWQALFQTHVGTHWDVQPDGKCAGEVRPTAEHQSFYGPYASRTPLDLSDNEVVGWCNL